MSWTEERVELLKRMWAEGQSASAIAKELGGVTRNAVIGKVHRLGLSNRAGGGPPRGGAEDGEGDAAVLPAAEDAAAVRSEARPRPAPAQADSDAPAHAPFPGLGVEDAPPSPPGPVARPVAAVGQPLPPQPSASEISPEALASVREVEKKARKLTLMELTERTCKWPIGDPATPDFWFCGLATMPGKPYCEAHVGVAFQPMSARRDRRR
jgi:GcrA cell cycle regulator